MNIYDFTVKDANDNDISLSKYRGKVILIVNTATECGLTPQYKELQKLYEQYHEQGLEILDFPCNQFRQQAPHSSSDIQQICQLKFGTEFSVMQKVEVNGPNTHPLFLFLKEQQPEDKGNLKFKDFLIKLASLGEKRSGSDIKWNFTKFLINRQGEVVARFAPCISPFEFQGELASLVDQ